MRALPPAAIQAARALECPLRLRLQLSTLDSRHGTALLSVVVVVVGGNGAQCVWPSQSGGGSIVVVVGIRRKTTHFFFRFLASPELTTRAVCV